MLIRQKSVLLSGLVLLLSLSTVQASSLKSVAKKLAKGVSKTTNKHIAVLPFWYPDGARSTGSSIVAERLTTLLVDRDVSVIERSLLDKVLEEMRLENSGLTDVQSAQKLGRMLGVDAVVTGILDDLNDQETELNARLIRTETGEVLAAATTKVDRTWHDSPQKPASVVSYDDSSTLHESQLIPVQIGPGGWRGARPPR
jgi:curli biogenesis system outer membrane secretion channel CsgG